VEIIALRRRIGMVFQKSNPFPMSIYENIVYRPPHRGESEQGPFRRDRASVASARQPFGTRSRTAFMTAPSDSPGDRCSGSASRARSPAEPEILLMDEPCSALDPIATAKVEELIMELEKDFTIVIVTHNMQQASRVSDLTAFFYLGNLIEMGETRTIFTNPAKKQTEEYITGRFG